MGQCASAPCGDRYCYACYATAPQADLEREQTPGIIKDNERYLSRDRMVGGTDYGYQAYGSLGGADDA